MPERECDISHDQLFKDLIRAFFREFMELFFPDVAARLDFSRVTFLDKQTFTDIPRGDQRDADLVAQVFTIDGSPEIILTHIEVEAARRSSLQERMFDYFMMLKLRHHLPIFPIVVYLSPGAGGLTLERHVDSVFDQVVNVFTFQAVGLPDLLAEEYQKRENPLAPALSALMKTSRVGGVVHKYQILRLTARSRVDEARKALLTNLIETYLMLDDQEQREFDELVATPEGKEIREMISVYQQRGIEKGIAIGERQTLMRLIRQKFGEIPDEVVARLESISDADELDRLIDRFLLATTLAEMGLEEN